MDPFETLIRLTNDAIYTYRQPLYFLWFPVDLYIYHGHDVLVGKVDFCGDDIQQYLHSFYEYGGRAPGKAYMYSFVNASYDCKKEVKVLDTDICPLTQLLDYGILRNIAMLKVTLLAPATHLMLHSFTTYCCGNFGPIDRTVTGACSTEELWLSLFNMIGWFMGKRIPKKERKK